MCDRSVKSNEYILFLYDSRADNVCVRQPSVNHCIGQQALMASSNIWASAES